MRAASHLPLQRKLLAAALLAAFGAAAQAATITVTTFDDVVADDGKCSLREAVIAANTNASSGATAGECIPGSAGGDTIVLAAGTYRLTLAGANEEVAATGDLDVIEPLLVQGAGASATIIDATGLGDRIFDIGPGGQAVTFTLTGARLTGGRAVEGSGGAIYVRGGPTAFLTDCELVANAAESMTEGGGQGGAVANEGITTITRCMIRNNTASGSGGALSFGGGGPARLNIVQSTVRDNEAGFGPGNGDGGGLYATGSNTTVIDRSLFALNKATSGGAISTRVNATVEILNSTLSGNFAGDISGGISAGGTVTLRASTVANNTSGNTSPQAGAGLSTTGASGSAGRIVVQNVLLADNGIVDATGAVVRPNANCGGIGGMNIVTEGGNLDKGTTCTMLTGTRDQRNVDPLLDVLKDNGGPTWTHALRTGSPAIDAGLSINGMTTDQRGETRPTDGNGDGTVAFDIGAYEAATVTPPAPTPTPTPQPPVVPPVSDGGGGGCTVGNSTMADAGLAGLLLAALAALGWRRRQRVRR